ncbi:MAG: caspase family protein [Bacteroidetes bacterium]|nr:caspase family protein [Bacteroidota bacterium]MBS1930290.1 caspase family protein [Bacteroidota bacterium]
MKKLIKFFNSFIIICYCWLGAVAAQSQDVSTRGIPRKTDSIVVKGTTYAIIIGLSKYKNVTPLQYADRDARSFEDFLLSEAGGKIPITNIETFLNENATRTNIGDAISEIARKAKPGDRVYFFFAGHGDMEDLTQIENGLLLLYNSPNGNYFGMNDDVLEIINLKRYLSPLSERGVEMIFIVDACHAGNLKGGVQGIEQTASALAASWGKEYKILSCQPNQLSLESAEWGGGRGLFSYELEDGMKGLADLNNDGVVSMYELQNYIQTNVAKYSEGKQIPMITGDLSKPFIKVVPSVLVALKKEKEGEYPMLAKANTKGSEDRYVDSLDAFGKKLYASFNKNISGKRLIWPADTNALKDYRVFEKRYAGNPLIISMRRNLAASLNDRFNKIVEPLLKGETSYSNRDECYYAFLELDSCMQLLGEQHYMYQNLKARKLFMDAMSYTWAINDHEYNVSMHPTLLYAVKQLEESAAIEPNASYTWSALGQLYTFLYEYDKADSAFQKYLSLRPNDLFAKYTLGIIYAQLKQYDKAEKVFESLTEKYPGNIDIKLQLIEVYRENNKIQQVLKLSDQLIATDSTKKEGFFSKGVLYSTEINVDSSVYYYKLTEKYFQDYCAICDNNIGQIYFVTGQTDSARKYFKQVLSHDSTYPFAHFNLGTIYQKEGMLGLAMKEFEATIKNSTTSLQGFVTNMQLYFGKDYDTTNAAAYKKFSRETFIFKMQYLAYLSMLYTYIRVPGLIDSTDNVNFLFDQLFTFKTHDDQTWFHYACYKALKKDRAGAIESLEKSLKLGFGNYFMLTNDKDLSILWNDPAFEALVKKYFPDRSRK